MVLNASFSDRSAQSHYVLGLTLAFRDLLVLFEVSSCTCALSASPAVLNRRLSIAEVLHLIVCSYLVDRIVSLHYTLE